MSNQAEELVRLSGLPGTHEDVLAERTHSVTQAMRALREGHPITASGNMGAINVWRDDADLWRCEFMRWHRTLSAATFKHLAAVQAWLKEWWPEMWRKAQ